MYSGTSADRLGGTTQQELPEPVVSVLADDVQLGVCVTRGLDDDISGRTVLDPRSVLLPTNNQLPPQGSGRRPEGKKCVKIKCHHLDLDQKMSAMVSPSTNLSF